MVSDLSNLGLPHVGRLHHSSHTLLDPWYFCFVTSESSDQTNGASDNNFRDGYMQPNLFEGESTSSPDDIGGVIPAPLYEAIQYSGSAGQMAGTGLIGRYRNLNYDWAGQARSFWGTLDEYAQQHTVDGYRFELGHVTDPNVTARYISTILNPIDNCLARRVAYGIGAPMPAVGSGPVTQPGSVTKYPSLYPARSSSGTE